MATVNNIVRSRRRTLVADTEDVLNFVQQWESYVVTNEDDTTLLTVTANGTAATVGGDDMFYVPPQSSLPIPADSDVKQVRVISSSTNVYSVVGL